MKYCKECGNLITKEVSHNSLEFCSNTCMDKYFLNLCLNEKISFLDIPKETRDRELKRKHYNCEAKECPICGAVFFTSFAFNDRNKKYCSRLCMRIGERIRIKNTWWKRTGWMSPNWRGGITNEEYCHKFNENLKRRVRAFFGNKCFLCGKLEKKNGKALAVHHVNYNKNACCDSTKVMLVPLCFECHGKTNNNREYWEDYFEKILKEQYNYKCYFTKEEYRDFKITQNAKKEAPKKIPRYRIRYYKKINEMDELKTSNTNLHTGIQEDMKIR